MKNNVMRMQSSNSRRTIIPTHECQTTLGLAPPGATSKIEPLDVAFNAEFKKSVDRLTTEHLFTNRELYMSGKVSAGDRRVLFTKLVGGLGVARDLASAERHSYPFICAMWYCTAHF